MQLQIGNFTRWCMLSAKLVVLIMNHSTAVYWLISKWTRHELVLWHPEEENFALCDPEGDTSALKIPLIYPDLKEGLFLNCPMHFSSLPILVSLKLIREMLHWLDRTFWQRISSRKSRNIPWATFAGCDFGSQYSRGSYGISFFFLEKTFIGVLIYVTT